jgi:hypothetical protein
MAAGLFTKYRVEHNNDPAGRHDRCFFFVLDVTHDPIAREVLADYANKAAAAGKVNLAADIWTKLHQQKELEKG